jgi:hypothetical protein
LIATPRSIGSDTPCPSCYRTAQLHRLRADRPAHLRAVARGQGDQRTPLVTIDYTVPSPEYAELLHAAVRAAESRYPDVQYDVVAVLNDMAESSLGQERATGVMRAIMRDRVPANRIHLGLRTDSALAASQVRVYVR